MTWAGSEGISVPDRALSIALAGAFSTGSTSQTRSRWLKYGTKYWITLIYSCIAAAAIDFVQCKMRTVFHGIIIVII